MMTCSTCPISPFSTARLERPEARVEAAVEGDHERHFGLSHRRQALIDAVERQVDRLFAEDGLAGARRGDGKLGVRVGRGRDDDRVDGRVPERLRSVRDLSAVLVGKRLRGLWVDVDDVAQTRSAVERKIGGMDVADAAGAELGECQHAVSPGGGWLPCGGLHQAVMSAPSSMPDAVWCDDREIRRCSRLASEQISRSESHQQLYDSSVPL